MNLNKELNPVQGGLHTEFSQAKTKRI